MRVPGRRYHLGPQTSALDTRVITLVFLPKESRHSSFLLVVAMLSSTSADRLSSRRQIVAYVPAQEQEQT